MFLSTMFILFSNALKTIKKNNDPVLYSLFLKQFNLEKLYTIRYKTKHYVLTVVICVYINGVAIPSIIINSI